MLLSSITFNDIQDVFFLCYTKKLGDDPGNWKIAFDTLTCIDTVTNLVELIRVMIRHQHNLKEICTMLAITLSVATMMCLHDPGGEFTREVRVSISIAKLLHQRYLYKCKKSTG
jgi:hypothetical protein